MHTLLASCWLGSCSDISAKNPISRRSTEPTVFALEDLSRTHKHLEDITAVSQYLFQVLQKGAIKTEDKREAQRWLTTVQDEIRALQRPSDTGAQRPLGEVLLLTNYIAKSLQEAMNSRFENLAEMNLSLVDLEDEDEPRPSQDELIKINSELVRTLQTESTTAGLTWINKWARSIDSLNNAWGITNKIETGIKFIGVVGLGLYLAPTRWFNIVTPPANNAVPQDAGEPESSPLLSYAPGLSWVKSKIGTTQYLDPAGYEMLEGEAAKPVKKRTLAGFVKGEDYKSIKHLGLLAFGLFSNEITGAAIGSLKTYVRPYWNALKGFDLPKSTYRVPDITLDDPRLIGIDSQVAEMKRIVDYMINPDMYDRAASGLSKAILFTGPSRTGKTMLAEALGGSLNQAMRNEGITGGVKFRVVSPNDLDWSRSGIQSVIEEAKANAPCVLFIDEIHNVGGMQTKETGASSQLYHFLTMADALKSTNVHDTVVLLAATNRPFMLDDALIKPGRFTQINFEMPTADMREKFFLVNFKLNGIHTGNLDIAALARQTENCSYGDLDTVFKGARFTAQLHERTITQADLEDEIITKIFRIRNEKDLALAPIARKHIAANQAAQALMHILHEGELPTTLELVTIRGKWRKVVEQRWVNFQGVQDEHAKKKTKYGHVITSRISEAVDLETNPRLAAKIHLAGAIAESILLGSTNVQYRPNDKRKALDQLEKIAFNGLKKEDFAEAERVEPMKRAKQDLAACEQELRELLTKHKKTLESIAARLDEKTLLKAAEIREIVKGSAPLPTK